MVENDARVGWREPMKYRLSVLRSALLISLAGSAAAIPPPPARPVEAELLRRLAPFSGHWSTDRVVQTPQGPYHSADFRDVRRVGNTILIVGGIGGTEIQVIAIDVVEETGIVRVFLPGRPDFPERAIGTGTVSAGSDQTCLKWEMPYHYSSDGYDLSRQTICVSGGDWRETWETVRADGASRVGDQLTLRRN
jgi:hypothetical protein